MSLQLVDCLYCKHLHCDAEGRIAGAEPTCDAFPESIPKEIIFGKEDPDSLLDTHILVSHREPYPGDHGILYEPQDPENNVDTILAALFGSVETKADQDQAPASTCSPPARR